VRLERAENKPPGELLTSAGGFFLKGKMEYMKNE
tara:strand:- start:1308 stop:1409 length:102 start_codon:yes stop_codon:yes gene_type:complete